MVFFNILLNYPFRTNVVNKLFRSLFLALPNTDHLKLKHYMPTLTMQSISAAAAVSNDVLETSREKNFWLRVE
jgi:hypothetical protein